VLKNEREKKIFLEDTYNIQKRNMLRLQEELKKFMDKYDYRFADTPWDSSKDSLSRSILKLTGNFDTK
jgi:hypothetical protein